MIKGWSGTYTVNECMPVWEKFQKSKSIDGHRNSIKTSMIQWGYDMRTEVDSAVFFENKIDDITQLKPNPGAGVEIYKAVGRGITLLTCRPLGTAATEAVCNKKSA